VDAGLLSLLGRYVDKWRDVCVQPGQELCCEIRKWNVWQPCNGLGRVREVSGIGAGDGEGCSVIGGEGDYGRESESEGLVL